MRRLKTNEKTVKHFRNHIRTGIGVLIMNNNDLAKAKRTADSIYNVFKETFSFVLKFANQITTSISKTVKWLDKFNTPEYRAYLRRGKKAYERSRRNNLTVKCHKHGRTQRTRVTRKK